MFLQVYFGGNAADDNLRPCAGPGGVPENNPATHKKRLKDKLNIANSKILSLYPYLVIY